MWHQVQHLTKALQQYPAITSFIVGILFLLSTFSSLADTYTFRVMDQHNKPLANAVVAVSLSSGETPKAKSQERLMDQINIAFEPRVLVINQGDSVNFPNSDNLRHHVYSFSAPKPFEIKLYSNTPEAPIYFEKPGIVVLGCNIHDNMLGYIYVSDTPYTTITDINGVAQIELNQAPSELVVWHERHSLIESTQMHMDAAAVDSAKKSSHHFEIMLPTEVSAIKPEEIQDHNNKNKNNQSHDIHGFGNTMRR